MMIAARNAFLMGGAKLPYDSEVEYLESTGTQCVDTGVYLEGSLAIELFFRPLNAGVRPFGAADTRLSPIWNQWAAVDSNAVVSNISVGSTQNLAVSVAGAVGRDLTMRTEGRLLVANGVSAANATWTLPGVDTNVTIGLFGCHVARPNIVNWAVLANMRLYSSRILDGDTVVRDFIPVRVGSGSSAVGYLYDRANPTGGPLGNGLYGNAADGQGGKAGFPANCVGPDK